MISLAIPSKITIKVFEDWIWIEGPLGIKKKKKSKNLQMHVDLVTKKLWILNENLKQKHFYLAILNKIILGVLKGFCIKLHIVGVGYKAVVESKFLILKLGFSHTVQYVIPEAIKIKVSTQKVLTLNIFGNDFQQVTQVASEIRLLKPAEPYKGKGIRYANEIVKKKEGKKSNV